MLFQTDFPGSFKSPHATGNSGTRSSGSGQVGMLNKQRVPVTVWKYYKCNILLQCDIGDKKTLQMLPCDKVI